MRPRPADLQQRAQMLRRLTAVVQQLDPQAELYVHGSVAQTVSTHHSDLDLCARLVHEPHNAANVVRSICATLQRSPRQSKLSSATSLSTLRAQGAKSAPRQTSAHGTIWLTW